MLINLFCKFVYAQSELEYTFFQTHSTALDSLLHARMIECIENPRKRTTGYSITAYKL